MVLQRSRNRGRFHPQAHYLLRTHRENKRGSWHAMNDRCAALGTMLLGIFGLAQQVLDAVAVFFGFVENEQHFGRAPHVQTLD